MKRSAEKLSDVISDIKQTLALEHNITQAQLDAFRQTVNANGHSFPLGSMMVPVQHLWIDYEVQRDVLVKHIINIIKRYDPRICSPASSCTKEFDIDNQQSPIFVHDGQHRIIATGVLGFTEMPLIVVETDDQSFSSYAFEESNMSTKRLGPGDIHRNRLVRYKLGNRELKSVIARNMQDQFDNVGVDLEDKATRKSAKLRGSNPHFFSHFKYAINAIELDPTGKTLHMILDAITKAYPNDEEVSQDLFIGLYEITRLDVGQQLTAGWMEDVLKTCAKQFTRATTADKYSVYKKKAKLQVEHISPGRGWDAPNIMSNFIRELYLVNSGTLKLPYHGAGSMVQLATNPAPGL